MDISTLLLVNLLFLFLYAAMMILHTLVYGRVRGGIWFAWSNLVRGAALLLLVTGLGLPRSLALLLGYVLLVLGGALLHRSLAEVLGKGKAAWNAQLGIAGVVLAGVGYFTYIQPSYNSALIVVCVALAMQMALTTVLLFQNLTSGLRAAVWVTGSGLFLYSVVSMSRAIAYYHFPEGGVTKISSTLVAALLVGNMLANGGTAFGFLFLSGSQLRRELTRLAEHDSLTGLLNRRGLKRVADLALSQSHRAEEPVSAVMLDLDGMKVANDTWGHECGDEMLRAVARLLVLTVGERGAVARLGGDEFVVMLPGMAEGGAVQVAEELRSSIEQLSVMRCRPRASFGVASMNGNLWEEAIRLSDEALYQAKNAGKNKVMCFAG